MNIKFANRLTALHKRMSETGVDLVALAPGAHMQWLLGFSPHKDERHCLLLVGSDGEAFLIPELNAGDARDQTEIEMHEWGDADGSARALSTALKAVGASEARNIVIDETMRADFALPLIDQLPKSSPRFTFNTIGELRMRKDESERVLLAENAAIADNAMKAAFGAIRAGMTEAEIAAFIREEFQHQNASPEFAIVASGPQQCFSASCHWQPRTTNGRCCCYRHWRPQRRLFQRHHPNGRYWRAPTAVQPNSRRGGKRQLSRDGSIAPGSPGLRCRPRRSASYC